MKIYINIYGIQNTKYIETNPQDREEEERFYHMQIYSIYLQEI